MPGHPDFCVKFLRRRAIARLAVTWLPKDVVACQAPKSPRRAVSGRSRSNTAQGGNSAPPRERPRADSRDAEQAKFVELVPYKPTGRERLLKLATDAGFAQRATAALTGDAYARVLKRSARDAIARLPSYSRPVAAAANGTTDAPPSGRQCGQSLGGSVGVEVGENSVPNSVRPCRTAPAAASAGFAQSAKTNRTNNESEHPDAPRDELHKTTQNGSGWESNPPSPTGVKLQRF
jgi:hypothetical protein